VGVIIDIAERASDSPLVDMVWHSTSQGGGTFTSAAVSTMEMVVTMQQGKVTFSVRGPETKASIAPIPDDAEFIGIIFKPGTFMLDLAATDLVDGGVHLPEARSRAFWLHGAAWEMPDFENADTFVDRLVRQGLMAREPIVEAALKGQLTNLSARSVQRRFLRATGLTHGTMAQIERARHAMRLLQGGLPILDVVDKAGFYDQPHLTRSLKHFIGQTPAQLIDVRSDE
jgi:AraC-like DNA-binding protein